MRSAARAPLAAAALFAVGLVASWIGAAHAQEYRWSDVPRVVAVGDVHGAHAALVELLQATGMIDDALRWDGGEAHFVSLGDLLDRGPDSRPVMDLLMRLQREARDDGGRVHVLLGNHELMNLIGDRRYVSRAEYAAFAGDETPEMRAAAFARFTAARAAGAERNGAAAERDSAAAERGAAEDEGSLRAEFDRRYPPGYFAHLAAFAPDGAYGSWLLSRPAVIVLDDTAYVHGGLSPLVAEEGLEVNDTIRRSLTRYLALREALADAGILPRDDPQEDWRIAETALRDARSRGASERGGAGEYPLAALEEFVALSAADVFGNTGPLWYRGAVYCKPLLETPVLESALAALEASRVVVGHTPTDSRRVVERYDGRLLMLDTGMLADYYAGRPAALVLENGATQVQYLAPRERGAVEPGARVVAHGLGRAELADALARGAITEVERDGDGEIRRVGLSHDGLTVAARFHPGGRRGTAAGELAAFRLDELLGTGLVPPTAAREVESEAGALQLVLPGVMTEAERLERGLGFAGWCPIEPQIGLMHAFDLLIENRARTPDDILYRLELPDLMLIDHAGAFGRSRGLPRGLSGDALSLSAPLRERLERLDASTIERALGDSLSARQRRALLERRDALLEAF